MADDPSDGYVLLFGGYDALGAGWLGDTWTFAGGNWTELFPTSSPSARSSAAAVYDPALSGVVLFGGYEYGLGSPYFNDTWLFKAGNWTQLATPVAPSDRSEAAMAYDPALGEIVLFGGTAGGTPLDDTWSYGSGGWTRVSTATAPPPINGGAMAYDANSSRLVLFGGSLASSDSAATWTFNGNWSRLTVPAGPDGRYLPAMTTLPNGSVFLSGGLNHSEPNPVVDAWELAGGGWVPIAAGMGPNGRVSSALIYDSTDGYVLFFGGRNDSAGTGRQSLNDTWAFDTLNAGLVPFPASGIAPFTVAPTATLVGGARSADGSSNVTYLWNFGDGTTSLASAPRHTYNLAGARLLALNLRDALGLSVSLSTTVTVGFVLNLSVLPLGHPELTYTFSASPMNATSPVSLSWHFGDGATSTLTTPTHTYG
ncbi:MAG TPA: PKD domain-containing protein, partial [Thermoplasmata archaeon]|nr:PKD domain-containing protein [Thermoplasmata archaeon]